MPGEDEEGEWDRQTKAERMQRQAGKGR